LEVTGNDFKKTKSLKHLPYIYNFLYSFIVGNGNLFTFTDFTIV
jgi:hypothetical protein